MISVTHLFFINYFLYLITSLCPCGFLLVQMCWARFPPVPDLAEPLHRTLSQVPAEDWLHCHILSEPQTVSLGSSLGPHIHLNGSLVLLWPTCIILLWATWNGHITPRIFSKACPSLFHFFQNSLWAQECRGCKTPGAVQCRYQPSLQSRLDCSPWGCLPKWPRDYWYPCERGCQDWVSECLRNHFFICGSWEWATGSFEIPCKMWWVWLTCLYSFNS